MFSKKSLVALAVCTTLLTGTIAVEPPTPEPMEGEEPMNKSPMSFCIEAPCDQEDREKCPAAITTSGNGHPACKVFETATVLGVGDFEASDGGATEAFLSINQPDEGCKIILKSPASTSAQGCGAVVGTFGEAVCTKVTLKETFMVEHCCDENCEEATGGLKMVRGIENRRRGLGSRAVDIMGKDGQTIEPVEEGYPPLQSRSGRLLSSRADEDQDGIQDDSQGDKDEEDGKKIEDDKECKEYTADEGGEQYTRPADAPQIVATASDGGTEGTEITISKSRTVEQSVTFSAGINLEVLQASTELSFSESLTDEKQRTWTVPAGQTGKVGFTPNLRCTRGHFTCKDGVVSEGEACTGYREADEIAGTFAVIATS
ncbi:MAG: hypothetical protein Q9205_007387 [Flavoplaca limonia]